MKTTLQLEDQNVGKPTCKKVITNRKNLSEKVPQAWYNKDTKEWYYNWNGAMMEAEFQGKKLPTQEEWKEIVESLTKVDEDGYFSEPIHKKLGLKLAGFRHWCNGQYYYQGTDGYYWSSSPTTAYSYTAYFYAGGGNIAGSDSRGNGFSIRCVKEGGKEEVNTSEKVECEVSDSSSLGLFDEVVEKLQEKIIKNEEQNNKMQAIIDLISNL